MVHGPAGLLLPIDLSLLHALQQFFRLDIHQLHLVSLIEHGIGNPLSYHNAGYTRDGIVQALQMLYIDGCIHIYACS